MTVRVTPYELRNKTVDLIQTICDVMAGEVGSRYLYDGIKVAEYLDTNGLHPALSILKAVDRVLENIAPDGAWRTDRNPASDR